MLKVEELVKEVVKKPKEYFTVDFESADTVNGLTKVPLIAVAQWKDVQYLTFVEATQKGFQVLETGSVPQLEVHNQTEYNVFIPAGQLFVSQEMGWQDRMAMCDMMLEKGYQGKIPVACVEHGRWHNRGREASDRYMKSIGASRGSGHFSGVKHLVTPAVMSCSLSALEECADEADHLLGMSHGVQSDIWDEVAVETDAADAKSSSGTLTEVYAKKGDKNSKFKLYENEIGAIFLGDGKVLGMEFYHNTPAWEKFADPVIKRYDLAVKDRNAKPNEKTIEDFLGELSKTEPKEAKNDYMGELVSLTKSDKVTGSCLVVEATPIHFIAMPEPGEKERDKSKRPRPNLSEVFIPREPRIISGCFGGPIIEDDDNDHICF